MYLTEVVEVLEDGGLSEEQTVVDRLGEKEGGDQVADAASLTAVRPKREGVHATVAVKAQQESMHNNHHSDIQHLSIIYPAWFNQQAS